MQAIPIFFASDDYYIPYVSATMQSVMENARSGQKYDFYILHRNIKLETMEKLRKQVKLFPNFSLNFTDMSQYIENYNFFVCWHMTVEAYFRLFIPYIFPNMEKAIYLDGDTICLTDISELFNIDVSDYFAAGTNDTGLCLYYTPKWRISKKLTKHFEVLLSMEHPENYINSGVLLINCKKFRDTYTMQYVKDTAISKEWGFFDQDVINVLAKDKILRLHKSWNYLPDTISNRFHSVYDKESSCWTYIPELYSKYAPEEILSEYLQAQKQPKIIHFKPYSVWYYIQYFDVFWKYATRTPFCKEIVARMDKNGIIGKRLGGKIRFTALSKIGFGKTKSFNAEK